MYPLYALYPQQSHLTRFPLVKTPIITNSTAPNSKPFLLYKGPLPPGREEAFKIYPLQINSTTISRCSSISSTNSQFTPVSASASSSSSYSSSDDFSRTDSSTSLSSDNDNNYNGNSVYRCTHPNCRYKGTFLSKDYLRRHVREQHRRAREHVCRGHLSNGTTWGCNKKFSRPYQLVNHWKGQRSLRRCGVPEEELRKAGAL